MQSYDAADDVWTIQLASGETRAVTPRKLVVCPRNGTAPERTPYDAQPETGAASPLKQVGELPAAPHQGNGSSNEPVLTTARRARLQNLTSSPELNGRVVSVEGSDERGLWMIRLEGHRQFAVRTDNLAMVDDERDPASLSDLAPGDVVEIIGLENHPQYNNMRVVIGKVWPDNGCCEVDLPTGKGETTTVRRTLLLANVQKVTVTTGELQQPRRDDVGV